MDHGNWLSLGETESSGSASSQSERLSDDQEYTASPNETSPVSTSPIHAAQSTEVSCKNDENEVHETVKDDVNETVKSLSEKLATALLSISAKEDLVKQHSKVAEEAVSGWEKAETEVTVLKQKLEATTQKNSVLEDKIGHLDGALKECVRQLRQSRDEQEQKVQDAVSKKTQEWESHRSQLENQLTQLKTQLETSKAESSTTAGNLQSKLEAIEKENVNLKTVLLKQSEELKVRTLERELSTQTAESASKQHLESIKKVAKLEAECRKLRVLAQKKSPVNDQKTMSSSTCVESLTDSQSDVEPSCSDSWASALIAELDQFKNEKSGAKVLTPSVDIDLMDDFLEMERLAALPETGNGSCSFGAEADSERVIMQENSSMVELEIVKEKMAELEEKLEKMVSEKAKLEMALADMQNHLENSCNQLTIAEDKLVQLQNELDRVKESKEAAMLEVVSVESERKSLKSQLDSTLLEVGKLQGESVLSSDLKSRLETSDAEREKAESQLHVAHMEIENLLEKVGLLEGTVEEERLTATSLLSKVEEVEAAKNTMVSQFMLANLEVKKLKEMSKLLEQIIEEEKSLSTEFSATLKVVKDEKKAVELELVSAQSELQNLSEMVEFLQRRVETEKALKAQFAAKCQNLEDQLSNKSREVEVRLVSGLNGELSVKQGKELVVAAEKLAECQKTIASLGNQLKSLTALDDYIIDTEKMEFDGSSPDSCTLPNGKENCTPSSPPSSTSCVSGVGR